MLTLPIKRKWFDMILTGEKTEEYREIKPYITKRLFNQSVLYTKNRTVEFMENWFRSASRRRGIYYENIILRNGYSRKAPAVKISGHIFVREGKPEWGAEPGREYYVLTIENLKVLRSPCPDKYKGGQNNEDV